MQGYGFEKGMGGGVAREQRESKEMLRFGLGKMIL